MPAGDLAYLINESSTDLGSWSGLNVHILGALRANGVEPVVVDRLSMSLPLSGRLRHLAGRIVGRPYLPERDPRVVGAWADRGARRLAAAPSVHTVVVTGSIPGVALPPHYELAIWADATFHGLRTTYPAYAHVCDDSIRSGDDLERHAFARARVVCFASDWAADDAVAFYGADPSRVFVVPFGANCDPVFVDESAAREAVQRRSRNDCHLVFHGVDWQRKGAALVLEVVELLRRRGLPARASLAGLDPPPGMVVPAWVDRLGYLDRQTPAGRARWDALMRSAHFLFVPSIAECYGLVYAEAAAYALPSIARRVGGVATAVSDGRSGCLLPPAAGANAYADAIEALWREPAAYADLAIGAWRHWRDQVNWPLAGRRFLEHLSQA